MCFHINLRINSSNSKRGAKEEGVEGRRERLREGRREEKEKKGRKTVRLITENVFNLYYW